MGLSEQIIQWERRTREYYNVDPNVPGNERRARIYNLYFDHALLRTIWTNFYEVAPGAYRSNHPTHKRFAEMRDNGIKTVLNLRGAGQSAHYLSEEASCRELGLTLISTTLHARAAASREELLQLIGIFKTIEKPFVMHCKSGADRAGLASAIYLIVMENRPVEEAAKMLSWRYWHFRNSKVGILDYILDCYAARNARDPIGFEAWVATEYDHLDITARFKAGEAPA